MAVLHRSALGDASKRTLYNLSRDGPPPPATCKSPDALPNSQIPAASTRRCCRLGIWSPSLPLLACHRPRTAQAELDAGTDVVLSAPTAAKSSVCVLMLQGRPVGEPVAAQGPFVMNTQASTWPLSPPLDSSVAAQDELKAALELYNATHYGQRHG